MNKYPYIKNMRNLNQKELGHTKHSELRCQQRGVPLKVVEFIVTNGDSCRTHDLRKCFINRKILNKLKYKHKEFLLEFDKFLLNTAVVVNNNKDTVVTVMKIDGQVRWN